MGKYSDPEPDYTKDRAAFANSEFAKRQQQAQAYNQKVRGYNNSLTDLNAQLQKLGANVNRFGIVDDEKWGGAERQITALEKQLGRLQNNSAPKPTFNSVVQSAYGPVEVRIPQLLDANTTLSEGFSSRVAELRTMLEGLRDEREAEQRRIDDFAGQLTGELGGLNSSIRGYDIGNFDEIQAARSQLNQLMGNLGSFRSDIAGEYRPGLQNNLKARIQALLAVTNRKTNQYNAERSRIDRREDTFVRTYNDLNNLAKGLSIDDVRQIERLQNQIDREQGKAATFSSKLDYDFSDEMSQYEDLEGRLSDLLFQRQQEIDRVTDAEGQAISGAEAIMQRLAGTDYYDGQTLEELLMALEQGDRDMNRFSTKLTGAEAPEWQEARTLMEQARDRIASIQSERATALSGFGSKAEELMQSLGGIALTDEAGLMRALAEAEQLSSRLGQFNGDGLNPYRDQITGLVDATQGRLTELGTERSSIEQAARALLSGAQTQQYSNTSQLDSLASQVRDIIARQTNYGANQAQDEVDALNALLSGERGRLEEEAEAEAARLEEERASMASFGGFGGFSGALGGWAPWMANGGGYRPGQLPSSFARQLNVVYA